MSPPPASQGTFSESMVDGLTYVEQRAEEVKSADPYIQIFWRQHRRPATRCALFLPGEREPATYIWIVDYTARFGRAAVPVVGFSAGATRPDCRRRGLFARLMRHSMVRASRHAAVAFLKGVQGVYRTLGFIAWAGDSRFHVPVASLLALSEHAEDLVERWNDAFRTDACALYNRVHEHRTASAIRDAGTFLGPRPTSEWVPGDDAAVCLRSGELVGYIFISHLPFGQTWRKFEVREIVAADGSAARTLLAYAGQVAAAREYAQLEVEEPSDSPVGTQLQSIESEYFIRFSSNGGWLAAVLDRRALLAALNAEILGRFGQRGPQAIDLLERGALFPDNATLLRVLLAPQGWRDVEHTVEPVTLGQSWLQLRRECPGAFDATALMPFLHQSDRY